MSALSWYGLKFLNSKIRVKKDNGYWFVISACGNFKEQYSSWNQVLVRLRSIK